MADNKKTKEDDIKKTNGTDEKDTKKVPKKEQELVSASMIIRLVCK
jgi:hypothetical protein